MGEDNKILIKYTLKDIRAMSFARSYSGIFNKILLFWLGFLILVCIAFVPIIVVASAEDPEFLFILPLLALAILFFSGIFLLPGTMAYLIQRNNYKKSKLLGELQCYEFNEEAVRISSSSGSFSLIWNDIFKVQELKPGFLIYSSPVKVFIIPRRCFTSQEQLDKFRSVLSSRVDKKKLKLKRYHIGKNSPDFGEVLYTDPVEKTCEHHEDDLLLELNFSLIRKDILSTNFKLYYTSPGGLIITGIGVLSLYGYVRCLLTLGYNLFPILPLGVLFTFFVPFLIYINSSKQFKEDTALQKSFTYKFYNDEYIVEHPSGINRIRWSDLVKAKETKTAFLLYISTQMIHVIPKRVFEQNKEGLNTLGKVIRDRVQNRK
ncbi:MAG: YcxB family protein [Bacillota bacterium]